MAKNKYHEDFPLLAEGFARRGLIDKEIAKKLGIGETAFYDYIKRYPKFAKAIKKGKAPVDVEVENVLLKRIRGFKYTETHIEYTPGKVLENGKTEKKKILSIRKIRKEVIPETLAAIYWLKNRLPGLWNKERTNVDVTVRGSLSIKEMKESLKAAEKDGSK